MCLGIVNTYEDLDQFLGLDDMGRKCCGICSTFFSQNTKDLRFHIEAVHFPNVFSYQCPDCPTVVNTRKALANHKYKFHRQHSK